MRIITLEQARKDFEHGVYDMTDNGKCTGCGACCSNFLPVSDKEIECIRKYIKKHGIKEQKNLIPVTKPALDMTCPFLMTGKKEKCAIYPVRPAICRCFVCSEPYGALEHKELFQELRTPVNMREVFFRV